MNSSVKSLVPIVTAGLPLPGCSELEEEPLLALLPLLLSSPPQPAAAASTAAASRTISRRVNRVDIGSLLQLSNSGGRGRRLGGRHERVQLLGQREAARRHRALHE